MRELLTLASSQRLLPHNCDEGWSEFDCTWHFCKKSSKVQHDKTFRSVRRMGLELYYNIRDKQCVVCENCGLRDFPPQLRLVKLQTETMLFACCSQQNRLSLTEWNYENTKQEPPMLICFVVCFLWSHFCAEVWWWSRNMINVRRW